MKVAFSLQRKLALEEGSIRHYEFNNGAAILVASTTHLLYRQDSSFLRPKRHHTATVSFAFSSQQKEQMTSQTRQRYFTFL
jgi:hypothetical protein